MLFRSVKKELALYASFAYNGQLALKRDISISLHTLEEIRDISKPDKYDTHQEAQDLYTEYIRVFGHLFR